MVLRGLTSLALPSSFPHGPHCSKQGLFLCSAVRFRWFQSSKITCKNLTVHQWWRWRRSSGRMGRWKEACGFLRQQRQRRNAWILTRHVTGWKGSARECEWMRRKKGDVSCGRLISLWFMVWTHQTGSGNVGVYLFDSLSFFFKRNLFP